MAGGGLYPVMTDAEWERAPWNEAEPDYCPECDGEGFLIQYEECPYCGGTGKI